MTKSAVEITKEIWRKEEEKKRNMDAGLKSLQTWIDKMKSQVREQVLPILKEYEELGVILDAPDNDCIYMRKNGYMFGFVSITHEGYNPDNMCSRGYIVLRTGYFTKSGIRHIDGSGYNISGRGLISETNFVESFAKEMANMMPR